MNSTESDNFLLLDKGQLVCRSVHWMDIVRFLVFNYVLHAVTVLSSPGEGLGRSIIKRLVALFIPLLGTVRAVSAIHRFARGQDTPLQVALRAQALCMIEPKNTSEVNMDEPGIENTKTPEQHPVRSRGLPIPLAVTTIQGQHPIVNEGLWAWIKDGCRTRPVTLESHLVTVPSNFTVTPIMADTQKDFDVAYNYSLVKIMAAIAQILYGVFQLYQTSGPQIQKFGYAAYQLTIIPYTIMSVINLIASLCEPEFPAVFLVRRDPIPGGIPDPISAEVGVASAPTEDESIHTIRMKKNPIVEWLLLALCFILVLGSILGPYLIIWILTEFKLGRDPGTVPVEFQFQWKVSSTKWFQLFNPWVVIWIAYGQLATLAVLAEPLVFPLGGLQTNTLERMRYGSRLYGFLGVLISLYGFSAVIRLMANDTVCVVV